MTTDKEFLSLEQRLRNLVAEFPAMAKTGTNSGQGNYKFIEASNIAAYAQDLFAKHGINLTAQVLGLHPVPADKGYHLFIEMEFTLFNADDMTDRTIHKWYGEAIDFGDKALTKAITAGYKSFLKVLCHITDKESDIDLYSPEEGPAPAKKSAAPKAAAPVPAGAKAPTTPAPASQSASVNNQPAPAPAKPKANQEWVDSFGAVANAIELLSPGAITMTGGKWSNLESTIFGPTFQRVTGMEPVAFAKKHGWPSMAEAVQTTWPQTKNLSSTQRLSAILHLAYRLEHKLPLRADEASKAA